MQRIRLGRNKVASFFFIYILTFHKFVSFLLYFQNNDQLLCVSKDNYANLFKRYPRYFSILSLHASSNPFILCVFTILSCVNTIRIKFIPLAFHLPLSVWSVLNEHMQIFFISEYVIINDCYNAAFIFQRHFHEKTFGIYEKWYTNELKKNM